MLLGLMDSLVFMIIESYEILILIYTQCLRASDASLPIAMRIQILSTNL